MIKNLVQIGQQAEHRGIVVTPLFPCRDPVAAYVTLDEVLASGLRIRETSESSSVPELLVENALAERVAPIRRRGARRREAEPHPERQRPRRGALDAHDPRLPRRAGALAGRLDGVQLGEPHLARGAPTAQGRGAGGATARARHLPK